MLVADTSTSASIYSENTWGCYDYELATSSAATIKYKYPSNNCWSYNNEGTTTSNNWYSYDYDCATTNNNLINWKQVVKIIKKYPYGTAATTSDCWTWDSCNSVPAQSPEDRLKTIIQQRQAPAFIRSRKHLETPTDIREVRARETLQRVLGDQKFRSFIKNGFVSVRAKSGLVYQIFPGHDITKVYRDGKLTERLCVVLKGRFPPTDSLIMRYLLILNDEQDFRKHAISHGVYNNNRREIQIDERPLTEIYREMKVA